MFLLHVVSDILLTALNHSSLGLLDLGCIDTFWVHLCSIIACAHSWSPGWSSSLWLIWLLGRAWCSSYEIWLAFGKIEPLDKLMTSWGSQWIRKLSPYRVSLSLNNRSCSTWVQLEATGVHKDDFAIFLHLLLLLSEVSCFTETHKRTK